MVLIGNLERFFFNFPVVMKRKENPHFVIEIFYKLRGDNKITKKRFHDYLFLFFIVPIFLVDILNSYSNQQIV